MDKFRREKQCRARPVRQATPLCLVASMSLLVILFTVMLFAGGCAGKSAAIETPIPTESLVTVITEATTAATPVPTTEPTPLPTPVPTPVATPEPTPDPMLDSTFILPDPAIRPVAVMIDNDGVRPLPQAGIRQAQIVYEVLTEYRITRYMALFWGTMPEMVGPVRSSRHYFLDWVMEYDAVYTHYGWSPQAQRDISKLHIQNINGITNGDAFWDTDKNRNNWQDSFTSKERVEASISKLKYRVEPKAAFPLRYSETFMVPGEGDPAATVTLTFGNGFTAGYAYNGLTGLYERTRNGKPQIERNTGLVVTPRNILVQVVPSSPIAGDEKFRINVKTVGSGKGWLVSGGKSRAITWDKTARDAQTKYAFEDGSAVVLNPGQTWIEVIPTAKTVVIQ